MGKAVSPNHCVDLPDQATAVTEVAAAAAAAPEPPPRPALWRARRRSCPRRGLAQDPQGPCALDPDARGSPEAGIRLEAQDPPRLKAYRGAQALPTQMYEPFPHAHAREHPSPHPPRRHSQRRSHADRPSQERLVVQPRGLRTRPKTAEILETRILPAWTQRCAAGDSHSPSAQRDSPRPESGPAHPSTLRMSPICSSLSIPSPPSSFGAVASTCASTCGARGQLGRPR
mmetsp:Transcript_32918/g.65470  ORF Transcript_32918/g.65470 Transcript_32918/m.65470 type:complete len:229 (+) Transcript_32918:150-836(+)